jgi:ATPase subunit of ABC transporter with duplicated ATPase domains
VGALSGGERNRLHLAKLLRSGGNLLLLDEPTNDLDVDTLRALEEALLAFAGCAVVISHDRWFLDRIATHILAAEGDLYMAAVGDRLVVKMGPRFDIGDLLPKEEEGWALGCAGGDYAVWVKEGGSS